MARSIETLDARRQQVTEDRIIRGMVGRDLTHRFPPREATIGEVVFEVRNWKVAHPIYDDRMVINDVSINVRAGEVVGHRGPDGRRPNRVRDERLRALVGSLRQRDGAQERQGDRRRARSRRRSRTVSPT